MDSSRLNRVYGENNRNTAAQREQARKAIARRALSREDYAMLCDMILNGWASRSETG